MVNGNFRRNPAADTCACQVELVESQRVYDLQIVKYQILNGIYLIVILRLSTGRMGGCNYPRALEESFVERHPAFSYTVNVNEAMKVE